MYCPNCGQQLPDSTKFCINCGKALQIVQKQPTSNYQPVVTATPVAPPPINQVPVQPMPTRRKPWYKRWWIWVILGVVSTLIISAIGNTYGKKTKPSNTGTSSSAAVSGNQNLVTNEPESYSIGDSYEAKGLIITVDSCEEYVNDNKYYQPKDGNIYIKVHITIENNSTSDKSVGTGLFECYADNAIIDREWLIGDDDDLTIYDSISPGRTVAGSLYYEVPKDSSVELEFTPSYLSNSKRVVYKIK